MVFKLSTSYLDDMFETHRPGSESRPHLFPSSAAASSSRAVRSFNRADDSPTAAAWSSPSRITKISWWRSRVTWAGSDYTSKKIPWWTRQEKKHHHDHGSFTTAAATQEDQQDILLMMKRYSLQEIQSMTDNFRHVIGEGGFATVHKGHLIDGSAVAVKRLKKDIHFQDYLTEFKVGTIAKHRNLISPFGYCTTQIEKILVFPFMARGTVEHHLRLGPSALEWSTRMRIMVSVAKVLAYLHEDCGVKIIHRDVKAANILLDENFQVSLADSGLAVFMDHKETEIITGHAAGTAGYIDPEYITTGKCSVKTDVYGYGVFVLELISGRCITDLAREACDYNVFEWVKKLLVDEKLRLVINPSLEGYYVEEEMMKAINLAIFCTERSPCRRPTMSQVVRLLERECTYYLVR